MVVRISVKARTAFVEGLLDGESLQAVLTECRACSAERLVLRAGTVVRAECVPTLAALDLKVEAESPFLARWLERARGDRR